MSPIQQMLLGVGAVATKTYVDDIFSSYLWDGSGSSRSINNGINLSESGGLVWTKRRDSSQDHYLFDTARGTGDYISTNNSYEEESDSNSLSAFNATGFSLGSNAKVNSSGNEYASWTFRKAPGFCDVVQFSGNGNTPQAIAHNLNSMPGMVIVKKTSGSGDWMVWHRDLGASSRLELNQTGAAGSGVWGSTEPTSTHFSVAGISATGASGSDYIAYVFAGGESTAATARSVDFDGNDFLTATPASGENYQLSGDFTIECWVKPTNNTGEGVFAQSSIASWSSWGAALMMTSGTFRLHTKAGGTEADRITGPTVKKGQWQHIALVRSGSTVTMYVDGLNEGSYSDSDLWGGSGSSAWFTIGAENRDGNANEMTGSISNFRVTRGQALYTSSFRPTTEPLTTTSQGATSSNVIILALNNSSVTGATVKDNIGSGGDPTASTDSPFDDPAGFVFGESGSENVIKHGSYVSQSGGVAEVDLGFEPQWVMIKSTGSGSWLMFDSMRGISTGGDDSYLVANSNGAEGESSFIDVTATGFKTTNIGGNGDEFIFTCIRRSDGYVGKPPALGTDVFAMDTGSGSSTIPTFDSGFPVDFALVRPPASTDNWNTSARLISEKFVQTNTSSAESSGGNYTFDSNLGWAKGSGNNSSIQSWMWKRHTTGFDCIAYQGDGVSGRQIRHSLGTNSPEMIWIKNRTSTDDWQVWHKDLTSGYHLILNSANTETTSNTPGLGTVSTTSFNVGNFSAVNGGTNENYMAFLFASVDKISKVGSFIGNGTSSSSTQTITLGFQPRFLITKNIDTNASWNVLDTTRGWGSGNDKRIRLDSSAVIVDADMGAPTSTGFTIKGDFNDNGNGDKIIYYAHA